MVRIKTDPSNFALLNILFIVIEVIYLFSEHFKLNDETVFINVFLTKKIARSVSALFRFKDPVYIIISFSNSWRDLEIIV